MLEENNKLKITGDLVYTIKENIDVELNYKWFNPTWVENFWKEGRKKFHGVFNRIS